MFEHLCEIRLRFHRATYMMENCEANNAKLLERLNLTAHQLNTTGLSAHHGNGTNNITSGYVLQKCDLETFLSDVGEQLCVLSLQFFK